MTSRRIPSLRDVARHAGVSVNTVSRALTGKPDVNEATRARVQELAKELGYMPNLLARSLLRGRSSLIGLVVTDCTNPFYAGLIRAIESSLACLGYAMLLATSNEDRGKEDQALTILQGMGRRYLADRRRRRGGACAPTALGSYTGRAYRPSELRLWRPIRRHG